MICYANFVRYVTYTMGAYIIYAGNWSLNVFLPWVDFAWIAKSAGASNVIRPRENFMSQTEDSDQVAPVINLLCKQNTHKQYIPISLKI
jgi:hypothetical protein